jgi:hypothetical protein
MPRLSTRRTSIPTAVSRHASALSHGWVLRGSQVITKMALCIAVAAMSCFAPPGFAALLCNLGTERLRAGSARPVDHRYAGRIDVERRRHVRVPKLCLCILERCALCMQKRAASVPEGMPADPTNSSFFASRHEMPSSWIVRGERSSTARTPCEQRATHRQARRISIGDARHGRRMQFPIAARA